MPMKRRPPLLPALITATALIGGAANAQGSKVSSPTELARAADKLQPGQWVWAANVAPKGPILVYVDLSRQLASIYRNGLRIGVATVSSGKEGFETPTGVFTILQKDKDHRSNKYSNAAMPYQQRLTWDGVALHAGGLPGYPESHGCVHLPLQFARELFKITNLGVTVVVEGNAQNRVRTSDASLLAPIDAQGVATPPRNLETEPFRWTPQLATDGPVNVIISKRDQTVVVLRNGIEIGRSVAEIDDTDPGSHVISVTLGPGGKPRFAYVGLPGHEEEVGRELDETTLDRVRVPRAFYQEVRPLVQPGATILITDSGVGEDTSRRKLTVIDAVIPTP